MNTHNINRIAIIQFNPIVGDIDNNVQRIINYINDAATYEPDIIVFPELAICGYPPEDLILKNHFILDNLKAVNQLVFAIERIPVIIGFIDKDDKKNLYNAAALIKDKRILGICRKIELPNYGVFDEKRYFTSGQQPFVHKFGNTVIGINICEDIWTEKHIKTQKDNGAEIIINISASPYHAGKKHLRKKIIAARAKETGTYVCYANMVGGQDELVFDGNSMIVAPDGTEIINGVEFQEDMIITDLFTHDNAKPKLPERNIKKLNKLEEIYEALVLGVRDYVRKNGFKKTVIGLSGGIDSAITAVIACDAVGADNVVGISMPSQYSSKETRNDAKLLASNLGIEYHEVAIKKIFGAYLESMKQLFKGQKYDVTEENIQSRIRGNILMAYSNKYGHLVLTTGNKSEFSSGYCTLYGDMAGGFCVLKDVPKTVVFELAKMRNCRNNIPLIPETIITRAPSAELRHNQKDTDSLPDYSILDSILKEYVEHDRSYDEIVGRLNINSAVISDVIKLVDRNEYKRRQAPPGVKITPKAFGKDRRLPITNRYMSK